jgi:hypothetical protein
MAAAEIQNGHIVASAQIVPLPKQLVLEIELFNNVLDSLKKAGGGDAKSVSVARSEIMTRSDLYKQCTREKYVRISEVRASEKQFLSDIFTSMKGYMWRKKFGWVGQKKSISKPEVRVLGALAPLFAGVTTNGSNIDGIDLTANNLDGAVYESIGSLVSCRFLNLNWNQIKGRLPRNLSSLSQLEELRICSNKLQGSLDYRSIQSLSSLRVLNLSFNLLSGSLPDAFENMSSLEELNLSGNRLVGELPPSMSRLGRLQILKLYNNGFSGPIPSWISDLVSLREVNISQNKYDMCRCQL